MYDKEIPNAETLDLTQQGFFNIDDFAKKNPIYRPTQDTKIKGERLESKSVILYSTSNSFIMASRPFYSRGVSID